MHLNLFSNSLWSIFQQFDFDFVETHRVKECRIRAWLPNDSAGGEEAGDDKEKPSSSARRKKRAVGMWNADGELLEKTELLVRYALCFVLLVGEMAGST